MAFKAFLLLVASFLLLTTRVLSEDEESYMEVLYTTATVLPQPQLAPPAPVWAPPPVPVKAPPPVPVKAPAPPQVPVKAPPPAPVPVKTPPPAPVAKPPTIAPRPPIKSTEDCIPQCRSRCSLHSRKRVCLRACMTCCDRCRCVPPGTYGNKEMCGKCYSEMTTRNNRYKCP